ncbi:MAG: phosphatidate cytidylyltransferase [Lachnospiraceae bacterium]|nr:phosphatidate cytidylyltransferase [Lachnospiraceae bacterium]
MVLSKFMNKSFFERLISGIILVIIALVTIILGGDVLIITLGLVSIEGLIEINRVFGIEKAVVGWISYVVAVAYYVLVRFDMSQYTTYLLVGLLIALMFVYVFKYPDIDTESIMAAMFGMIYVAIMLSYIYFVRMDDNGAYNVWLIFLCSWGCDTCAYVFGVAFGKHKMTPVLSPKKTVEGAIGGIFGAALLGFVYASVFRDNISASIDPRIAYPVVCAIGGLISMVGDLAASAIKRKHGIKDYAQLIPGHGGILDRFDSVIFVAPIISFMISIMQ